MKNLTIFTKVSILLIATLGFTFSSFAEQSAGDELLPPDVAFKASAKIVDNKTIQVTYNIADDYYLYHSKFKFRSNTDGVTLGEPNIPKGKLKNDPFFGEIQTHRYSVIINIPFVNTNNSRVLTLVAGSQGCADLGVCYPPYSTNLKIDLPKSSIISNVSESAGDALQSAGNALQAFGQNFGLDDENEVLHPDEAFKASVISSDGKIDIRVEIAEQHYLYQNKFTFALQDANGFTLGKPNFSVSEEKEDPFFGKIQVYHHSADINLAVNGNGAKKAKLLVTYQGCSESSGICYPPQKKTFDVDLSASASPVSITAPTTIADKASSSTAVSEQDKIAETLVTGNIFITLLSFFGLGLLLAFTPCVFPMIPILSSIIVGHGEKMSTKRAISLSFAYVLAMAFTYTSAGVIVGLLGVNVQIWFQNPIVLSAFAAMFVLLSFSMFGFYELQMPASIQSKLTTVSNDQKAGSLKGAAIMGFLSALIVGPCVTAPLVGALIYIAETGDAVLGGMALFSLSMGMGAPLILIGASAGKILPKAGTWMDATKAVFGVMLLAMAIWMLERVLPMQATLVLSAILLIGSGIYSGAFEAIGEKSGWFKLWKTIGFILVIYGSALFVGALSGGNSFFAPLKGSFSSGSSTAPSEQLQFEAIKGIAGLNTALAKAKAQNRNVMLDFSAEWCISCKEMDAYTFNDARVKMALGNALILKADVTDNDATDQALLKHFGLFGPPGIIFYNTKSDNEVRNYRVVGFMEADKFVKNINNAFK